MDEQEIIIKKIKKTHGGHHGGAWKVAYADFVTAMMALFMVLWLVAMMSAETRHAVADYFRSFSLFKGENATGGTSLTHMPGEVIHLLEESGGIQELSGSNVANMPLIAPSNSCLLGTSVT